MANHNTNEFPDFLEASVDDVAKKLLGCEIEREIDGQSVRARIVETESYDENDEASHSYRGERGRNAVMFKEAGHLYVYFTYGMRYCCNIVTGKVGQGSAVLIRAVEPVMGKELLEKRRAISGANATNGPAKLCQALDIDVTMNGHDLRTFPMRLFVGRLQPGETITTSPRIGISKAKDLHRRFYLTSNPYVSR